jgi:hypothetical protein
MSEPVALKTCNSCNEAKPPNEFQGIQKRCKQCNRIRERERQAAKSPLRLLYDKLLWMRSHHKMRVGFLEFSDVEALWNKCEGKSVISGKPAESIIVIDFEGEFSIKNVAPVTKYESYSFARRRKTSGGFPPAALKKLEALTS